MAGTVVDSLSSNWCRLQTLARTTSDANTETTRDIMVLALNSCRDTYGGVRASRFSILEKRRSRSTRLFRVRLELGWVTRHGPNPPSSTLFGHSYMARRSVYQQKSFIHRKKRYGE